MGDIYSIKTKKKIKQPRSPNYQERFKQCLIRTNEKGTCDCELCKAKVAMTNRMYGVLQYLCRDYEEKTGNKLLVADAFEIATALTLRIRNEILNP